MRIIYSCGILLGVSPEEAATMFRMKFQTRDTAGEDEEIGVQERYRERTAESVGCSPASAPAVILEGRVGKFGKIQRFPNPDKAVAHHESSLRSLTLSPNMATSGSYDSEDVDLEGPVQEVPHYALIFDVDALKEPVKPIAESLHVRIQGSTKESQSDKNVIVTNIHYLTSVKCQDVHMDSVSSQAPALGEARTYCVHSASPDADSECRSSYMNEGKPRWEHENETVTGLTNKTMQKRKSNEPSGHDDTFAKSWEEPLLSAHDQAKLDLLAKEDAKIEAERLAEEERRNCERQRRELRDLANCVGTATTPGGSFRKSKLQKILHFFQNPFRVFRSQKMKHGGHPLAREAKVMNPNARLFRGCHTVPSGPPNSILASMRNASEKSTSGSNIQFAKVDSTNRDVPGWTREEYLRKNGKIPDRWDDKKAEEDFGGALGNYLNNYVVAGMAGGVSSDSDSDSD